MLGIYLTENLPTVDRGKHFIMYCAFLPIGLATSAGVAVLCLEDFDEGDWRYYLNVIGVIQIFLAIVTFILIEPSPRFLIFNGQFDEAKKLLTSIAKRHGTMNRLPDDLDGLMENWHKGFTKDVSADDANYSA